MLVAGRYRLYSVQQEPVVARLARDVRERASLSPEWDRARRGVSERLGKPDLQYKALRLLFEYEGDYHRTSPAQSRIDIARRERFEAHGWRVVRVMSDDLYVTPLAFVARARRVIALCDSRVQ